MNPTPPATSVNVLDLLVDAVCVVDAEGRYVFVSAAFERIFGYAPHEVIGRRMIELVHPADRERTMQVVAEIMSGQYQLHFENRYVRKDGRTAHIVWSARWSPEDKMRVAVARDVTERKRTESLQAAVYAISEAAYAVDVASQLNAEGDPVGLFARIHEIVGRLLPASNFSVALFDAERHVLRYPYHVDTRQQATSMPPAPRPLSDDVLCAEVIRSGQTLLVTPASVGGLPARLANALPRGVIYWLGVPLHAQQGSLGLLVLQGYTEEACYTESDKELLQYVSTQVASAVERNQMHARLQHMAQYDQLTQLPNRQLFHDRLRTGLARARREHSQLALLFLDLDGFKQVNDSFGHARGDLLLQAVAARLCACVRAVDTVARLGAVQQQHEFIAAQAAVCASMVGEKILAAFRRPFDLAGQGVDVRPSIGVALYPADGAEAQVLLAHADQAMYLCKKNGGNRFGGVTEAQPWGAGV
jgi:diguanylate cyclase (GGDEF)-like protein/PAS domain S-box-containing protein